MITAYFTLVTAGLFIAIVAQVAVAVASTRAFA